MILRITNRTFEGEDILLHLIKSDVVPRTGEFITIENTLDGENGSIEYNTIKGIEYVYKISDSYGALDYVKVYI